MSHCEAGHLSVRVLLAEMNRSIKREYGTLRKITERLGGCSILNRGCDVI